jgi:phosphate acetyltransferase
MNDFIRKMTDTARENPQRIVFPETTNLDILRTAEQTVALEIGYPLLIGSREVIEQAAKDNDVSTTGFDYFDYTDEKKRQELADAYTSRFEDFSSKAVLRKAKDPLYCALFLLKLHQADCVAAGKDYSTGDVVFAAISVIGLQPGIHCVSSLGIADVPGFSGSEGTLFGIADCAVNVQPGADELAGIAIASADTVRTLLGWEPRIAMLSFSTCGSAEHESLDTVRNAIVQVRTERPDIKIDGEFQLDSAVLPSVAAKKVKRVSEVAGKANILIFPNLHAGNIAVKAIQIFGHANAYGPVLQGFTLPVCDFSRGAPVEEMLGNVAMLVIRAAKCTRNIP